MRDRSKMTFNPVTENFRLNKFREPLKRRLLPLKEAAEYLGMSVCAVMTLIHNGKIPVVKGNGSIRPRMFIDIIDLDKWIEQNKITYTF